eukprot:1121672-Pyramimonas_sp.AAC.2
MARKLTQRVPRDRCAVEFQRRVGNVLLVPGRKACVHVECGEQRAYARDNHLQRPVRTRDVSSCVAAHAERLQRGSAQHAEFGERGVDIDVVVCIPIRCFARPMTPARVTSV